MIIEFETARSPLNRLMIQLLGPAEGSGWRSEGFNRQFRDGALWCQPHLVVTNRIGDLAFSRLMRGHAPLRLARQREVQLLLECELLRRAFERDQRAFQQVTGWLRFEDGHYRKIQADSGTRYGYSARAREVIRERGLREISTGEMAQILESDRNL